MAVVPDVVSKSVTKADNGPVMFQLFSGDFYNQRGEFPDVDFTYWTPDRDTTFRNTVKWEGFWATAVNKSIVKASSKLFEIEGDVPIRVRRAQEMFLAANTKGHFRDGILWGDGWDTFLDQHLRSYLLTDNGAFVEVVYHKSRVVGFIHLDPSRCEMTNDLKTPVVYTDAAGGKHEMPAHTVFHLADFVGETTDSFGRGQCAASQVYDQARLWYSIQRYYTEKITGRRAQKIGFIGGMTERQLQQVVGSADANADAKGMAHYMGMILSAIPTDQPLTKIEFDLMGLPDSFDRQQEWEITTNRYATPLGLSPYDLANQRIGGFGSGGQARVLDESGKQYGLAGWRRKFLHMAHMYLLDSGTRFVWSEESDASSNRIIAETASVWSKTLSEYVDKMIISPEQALAVAAANFDLTYIPAEFVAGSSVAPSLILDDQDQNDLGDGDKPSQTSEVPDPVLVQKSLSNVFKSLLLPLSTSLASGAISEQDYVDRSREAISTLGTILFKNGAGIRQADDLAGDEFAALSDYTNHHSAYLPDLASAIKSHSGDLDIPISVWSSKLSEAFWLGRTFDPKNPDLEWVSKGDVCADCQSLVGVRAKAADWRQSGYHPRSGNLPCRGLNCDCGLM